jgi:hypothetical protein
MPCPIHSDEKDVERAHRLAWAVGCDILTAIQKLPACRLLLLEGIVESLLVAGLGEATDVASLQRKLDRMFASIVRSAPAHLVRRLVLQAIVLERK